MGIDGPDFQRWAKWIQKKRWQVRIRQHLSSALSTILLFAVLFREWLGFRQDWPPLKEVYRQGFMMAECFASIHSQAREITEAARKA
jgi:hypothetical protein